LTYTSNVYIVSDPANPQNEGKVFLYKYGTKIFEKIQEAANPQFNDEPKVDAFDLWKGGNFRIKIRKVGGFTNYDKSEFDSPSVLLEDKAKLERILKSMHPLQPFLDSSNFKSYDELKTRLFEVLGGDVRGAAPNTQKTAEDIGEELTEKKPSLKSKKPVEQDVDDESDAFSYFQKLASE
jgi:hypothetical protein